MFFLTQRLLKLLEAAGRADDFARVINIGSIDGMHVSGIETYSYAASKAGVLHLTRMMAKYLAKKYIAVNAIAPGCPSCTALLDNWEGAVPHIEGLGANIAAVAKAPIERVAAFAAHRGWRHLKLLSAANNSFKRDYHGEDENGQQVPILTVFHKGPDGVIRLSWASELLFFPTEPGQDPRHVGTVEPMWTLLDLTPGGRPNANEQIEYECCPPPEGPGST